MGLVATSPLLSRGPGTLQSVHSGGQNQPWSTSGQIGYITPDISGGFPNASKQRTKSAVAHM